MSVVQNYLNGLKQTYDEILGEDEWRDFVACICGASDEDIAKLKAQFPLIPQSLIELLQFVDGTNWRTYQGSDVSFFILHVPSLYQILIRGLHIPHNPV